jgi:hypothetical protein
MCTNLESQRKSAVCLIFKQGKKHTHRTHEPPESDNRRKYTRKKTEKAKKSEKVTHILRWTLDLILTLDLEFHNTGGHFFASLLRICNDAMDTALLFDSLACSVPTICSSLSQTLGFL